MRVALNTDVAFTSLQPLKKAAAHVHEQHKMDQRHKRCGSFGCKKPGFLGSSNTHFMAAKEYRRYFTETAHWCRTDEISRCYFQNYPHNLLPLFESPHPGGAQVGTKGESNDSPLWRKKKKKTTSWNLLFSVEKIE